MAGHFPAQDGRQDRAETDKEKKIYCSEPKHFKRYYDENSNVEGETKDESETKDKVKLNYKVPLIVGLGIGTISYVLAKKFQKNALFFGLAGLVLGVTVGHYIANKGLGKKEEVKK